MALILVIQNDGTGTDDKANYNWEVRVNRTVLARGHFEGHNRSWGWGHLIDDLVNDVILEDERYGSKPEVPNEWVT